MGRRQQRNLSHGVSHAEIEEVFAGPLSAFPDAAHSLTEERIAIGKTAAGRHVFLVFTLRTQGERVLIRPISARFMHAEEIQAYEKAVADPEE